MFLQIANLKKSYFAPDGSVVPIIDIDSLSIDAGQQVALVGSSGSGKTTLLHLVAGILAPDAGQIIYSIDSQTSNLTALSEAARDVFRGRYIGYIFQTHHLLPGFTALENVLLGMSFTGRRHDSEFARHLLAEVGLAERLHYKPDRLSVGQQQRVAVARALANRPRLVLADEPTGALDPANARQVLELIQKLCREVQATLLTVSHDPAVTGQFSTVLHLVELNSIVVPAQR